MNRDLSQLELTVLGVVSKKGPCSGYAVMREFEDSSTIAYRSGAGSIYPILKRLAVAGLLYSQDGSYLLTDSGWTALRAWLGPPFAPEDFASNLDLLRTRVYFLKALEPAERARFVADVLQGLKALLRDSRRKVKEYRSAGDRFSEAAMRGAVAETKARIAWIREVADVLRAEDL